MSILVSFVSGILVLGTPAEMYTRGTQLFMRTIGYCLACVLSSLLFVPLFFNLKVTSSFEVCAYMQLISIFIFRHHGSTNITIKNTTHQSCLLLLCSDVNETRIWRPRARLWASRLEIKFSRPSRQDKINFPDLCNTFIKLMCKHCVSM